MAIRNISTFTARGSTLVVRISRMNTFFRHLKLEIVLAILASND